MGDHRRPTRQNRISTQSKGRSDHREALKTTVCTDHGRPRESKLCKGNFFYFITIKRHAPVHKNSCPGTVCLHVHSIRSMGNCTLQFHVRTLLGCADGQESMIEGEAGCTGGKKYYGPILVDNVCTFTYVFTLSYPLHTKNGTEKKKLHLA